MGKLGYYAVLGLHCQISFILELDVIDMSVLICLPVSHLLTAQTIATSIFWQFFQWTWISQFLLGSSSSTHCRI